MKVEISIVNHVLKKAKRKMLINFWKASNWFDSIFDNR